MSRWMPLLLACLLPPPAQVTPSRAKDYAEAYLNYSERGFTENPAPISAVVSWLGRH
jgi:hypothetical protein